MGTFWQGLSDLFSGRKTKKKHRRRQTPAGAARRPDAAPDPDSELQAVPEGGEDPAGNLSPGPKEYPMTPERAELIRQAMDVHRAKQQMLASLPEAQRHKLALLAHFMLSGQGRQDKS